MIDQRKSLIAISSNFASSKIYSGSMLETRWYCGKRYCIVISFPHSCCIRLSKNNRNSSVALWSNTTSILWVLAMLFFSSSDRFVLIWRRAKRSNILEDHCVTVWIAEATWSMADIFANIVSSLWSCDQETNRMSPLPFWSSFFANRISWILIYDFSL